MKKALFEELTGSIREAGAIRRAERQPSRTFEFTADDIRAIRDRLHKSQSEFAQMIGVTVSTLQNWEQGRRVPHGPARALLLVASREPQLVANALASAVHAASARASRKVARSAGTGQRKRATRS
jgi:putative transcriptional regulator